MIMEVEYELLARDNRVTKESKKYMINLDHVKCIVWVAKTCLSTVETAQSRDVFFN